MQISCAKIIDHSFRRCGLTSPMQNPEELLIAKENLQFVFYDYVNRGCPIWTVQPFILGLEPLKWQYTFDQYVYDVFNVNWRTFSHLTVDPSGGTNSIALTDYNWYTTATTTDQFLLTVTSDIDYGGSSLLDTAQLGPCDPAVIFTLADLPQAQYLTYWGINPVGNQTHSFVIEATSDLLNWTVLNTYTDYTFTDGQWLWVDLVTPFLGIAIRIRLIDTVPSTLSLRGFYTGNMGSVYEQVTAKLNRDDFFAYPNKGQVGTPINFYFLKDNPPSFQLWQSAQAQNCFRWAMNMYIMNVPKVDLLLPIEIPVPDWFFDAFVWCLAAKLVYELPNADKQRIPMIVEEAAKAMSQAEESNSDSSNLNLLGAALGGYQGWGGGRAGR